MFLQQLALLRGFDIGAMDPVGADFIHTVVEAAKAGVCRPRSLLRRSEFLARVPLAEFCCRINTTTNAGA